MFDSFGATLMLVPVIIREGVLTREIGGWGLSMNDAKHDLLWRSMKIKLINIV